MNINKVDEFQPDLINNNDLRVGHLILLKNYPCKIFYIAYSHTGKHGIAKMLIQGYDIFNGTKYKDIWKRHDETQLLKIITTSYFVTNLDNNTLYAFDEKYNQLIQIDLASKHLCKEVIEQLLNGSCTVTLLSYENLHKIDHVFTPLV